MAFHFIAISSSYSQGHRIGWHYSSEERLDLGVIKNFMKTVEKECGELQFAVHKLSTESTDFESVVRKDKFFEDVVSTSSVSSFIELLKMDKVLSAVDIAKFILTIQPMSQLKLQKILYYAYADFLIKTGKKLFKEDLVAFRYGPVVKEIYRKYRRYGSSIIEEEEDDVFELHARIPTPISFMKIVSSEVGIEAVTSIIGTLDKYLSYSASELVTKTHRKYGPWDRAYLEYQNRTITDESILKYHYIVQ